MKNIFTLECSKSSPSIHVKYEDTQCIYKYNLCMFNCKYMITDVKYIGLCLRIPIQYLQNINTNDLSQLKLIILCNVSKPYTFFIAQDEYMKNKDVLYISSKFSNHTVDIDLTNFDINHLFYEVNINVQTPLTVNDCFYIKQLRLIVSKPCSPHKIPSPHTTHILIQNPTHDSTHDSTHDPEIKYVSKRQYEEKERTIERLHNELRIRNDEMKILEKKMNDLSFLKIKNKELEMKVEELANVVNNYEEEMKYFEEFEKLNDELNDDYEKLENEMGKKCELIETFQHENAELLQNNQSLIQLNSKLKDDVVKTDATEQISMKNKIDMLERKLNSYKDKLEKLQKRNRTDVEKQIMILTEENERLHEQLSHIEHQSSPNNFIQTTQTTQITNDKEYYSDNMFENVIDAVYVINLVKRKDKRDKMLAQFAIYNMNVKFVDAIDGTHKSEVINYNAYCNDYKMKNKQTPKIRSEEYAYIRTINGIMNEAIYEERNKIMICDDDVILCRDFRNTINEILGLIDKKNVKCKLLYFGASQRDWEYIALYSKVIQLNETYSLYHCYHTQGSFMTLYDKDVFSKIIEYNSYSCDPFDCHAMWKIQNDYKDECYVIKPNVAIADVRNSDIRAGREMKPTANVFQWKLDMFDW